MKTLGYTLHAAAIASVLAAIWTGHTWQFALTALVLFLAGAAVRSTVGLKHHGTPQNSARNEQEGASGPQGGPGESGRSTGHTGRREYGRKVDQ